MQQNHEQITIPQMVDEVRAGKLPRRTFMKTLTAMGISATGVAVIAEAALRTTMTQSPATMHAQEDVQRHMQLHDEHIANQAGGELEKLHEDYHEDALVEDSMFTEPFVGRAAIIRRKQLGLAATAGVQIAITNRVVHGNQITVEWTATGTHTGEYAGVAAHNHTFTLHGVTVTVRRDDKIVRESLYYDPQALLTQLRRSEG